MDKHSDILDAFCAFLDFKIDFVRDCLSNNIPLPLEPSYYIMAASILEHDQSIKGCKKDG